MSSGPAVGLWSKHASSALSQAPDAQVLRHDLIEARRVRRCELAVSRSLSATQPVAFFADRHDAGTRLARELAQYADRPDVITLALPRGGVPVAYEVAKALRAPLDVFVVRKLGMPGDEEFAIGAIASGGVRILDDAAISSGGVTSEELRGITEHEHAELQRQEKSYRGERPFPELSGKTVILVDDGLATGATMRAAVEALRRDGPAKVVVAVPVGAADTCDALGAVADDVVCAITPDPFHAVGVWYADFSQTTDEEIHDLLERSRMPGPTPIAEGH